MQRLVTALCGTKSPDRGTKKPKRGVCVGGQKPLRAFLMAPVLSASIKMTAELVYWWRAPLPCVICFFRALPRTRGQDLNQLPRYGRIRPGSLNVLARQNTKGCVCTGEPAAIVLVLSFYPKPPYWPRPGPHPLNKPGFC